MDLGYSLPICRMRFIKANSTLLPKFDDSFPEKLLKIVATTGEIFSLKFIKYRLTAELARTRWES